MDSFDTQRVNQASVASELDFNNENASLTPTNGEDDDAEENVD